jgi:carboxyl-terminal processing protease
MRFRFFFAAGRLTLAFVCGLLFLQAHASSPIDPSPAQMLESKDTTDANIALITADVLQTWHYTQHPFDAEIAGKFLDRYLDTLDYYHMYFLKSDLDEFDAYRTNLNILTLQDHDIRPCWMIYVRFMERAGQRVSYVTNLLAAEKFDFTSQDRFVANRHTLPYPRDSVQAKDFWREELRCEYLDQLLSAPDIQFSGPFTRDSTGRAVISLTRDKSHPLKFDFLPKTFLARDGHAIGSLEVDASQSNATLRFSLPNGVNLRKLTNSFFSAAGEDMGDVSFRHETASATNTAAPGGDTNEMAGGKAAAFTNLEAVIHLKQKNMAEVYKTLTNHYVQLLKNYKELDSDRVFEMYLNSLARAYDPHSDYMGHMQAENFAIQMKLSLFGIGAILTSEDGYCKIAELKEGPAAKSGKIKPGDRIVSVAQTNAEPVDVVGMPVDKVVEMIRGPKGTEVTLTLIPADAADSTVRKEVPLVRDEIKLDDQAAKARLFESPGNDAQPLRVGVIDLSSFYADNEPPQFTGEMAGLRSKATTIDVARLVHRLKKEKVSGIILDLRRNGGGYLEEAIKLTGLFITRGPVVQTKDPNGDIVTDSDPDPSVLYDGPLIVLTSRFSASASEILAGALQDYNRALIVGDHSTFGKGTVQTVQRLAPYLDQKHLTYDFDPGSLKVTIKKFYRAAGVSTQLRGVISDIELPSIWNYASDEVGESSLPNALPCDEVASAANLENLNRVKPYLPELQQASARRVATSTDFAYIKQDIDDFLKEQSDKSISLNVAFRLADQKTKTERAEARKKERQARKKSADKVYEITMKNVDLAELQTPPVKTNSVPAVKSTDFEDDSESADAAGPNDEAVDPTLDETRRIMADYITLINRTPIAAKAP